ncbi:type IV pilus modification protein PilV [Candidatus Methylocalor cossyra]|uniref:Type IV fimbrial biogenesis protein PilV n=1 Tax=Candidatus Methylocalor cossyra TaxID=3108543 RepID=A0ABM9NLJ6_9GAMM
MLKRRRHAGFTLLEVLVAMVVLAIGLLGLAGLQNSGLRSDLSAYHRSQATLLAYTILDAMRANRQTAVDGGYNYNYATPPAPLAPCSAPPNPDLVAWCAALAAQLPQGTGGVNVAGNGLATVVVQWDDSRGASAAQQFTVQSQL